MTNALRQRVAEAIRLYVHDEAPELGPFIGEFINEIADAAADAAIAAMPGWPAMRPMKDAPKNKPVLVLLSMTDQRSRDGEHGPVQVATNRGMGWISIPGLWRCNPVGFWDLPSPPTEES